MARVFLSYARDDVETARKLAAVLTEAGHTIWWDRHLHGGANFSSEIDRELKNAEVVMVLWSSASIASAWVQDEAAEGRDSAPARPCRSWFRETAARLSADPVHRLVGLGQGRPNGADRRSAVGDRQDGRGSQADEGNRKRHHARANFDLLAAIREPQR